MSNNADDFPKAGTYFGDDNMTVKKVIIITRNLTDLKFEGLESLQEDEMDKLVIIFEKLKEMRASSTQSFKIAPYQTKKDINFTSASQLLTDCMPNEEELDE